MTTYPAVSKWKSMCKHEKGRWYLQIWCQDENDMECTRWEDYGVQTAPGSLCSDPPASPMPPQSDGTCSDFWQQKRLRQERSPRTGSRSWVLQCQHYVAPMTTFGQRHDLALTCGRSSASRRSHSPTSWNISPEARHLCAGRSSLAGGCSERKGCR